MEQEQELQKRMELQRRVLEEERQGQEERQGIPTCREEGVPGCREGVPVAQNLQESAKLSNNPNCLVCGDSPPCEAQAEALLCSGS